MIFELLNTRFKHIFDEMAKEYVIDYSTSLFWNKDLLLSLGPCWNHDSFPIIHHSKMRLLTITFYSFFMTNYVVDDGSGTICCCKWHSQDLSTGQESYDLGQLVTVQGKISVFREQRQLTIDLICIQTFYLLNYTVVLHHKCGMRDN